MNPDTAMQCRLDHLVVCAQSCDAGVQYIERLCGIAMPEGGKHPLMATHNHLSALSNDSFLEIIAIDPSAEPIASARWFQLDDPDHQSRLRERPRLTTWVANTNNLDAALQVAADAGIDAGEPVKLSRGNLNWRLALRSDGSLACHGLFPILIEWPEGINPVKQMQDQGIRLDQLTLTCPDVGFLQTLLQRLGLSEFVTVKSGEAAIQAELHTDTRSFQLSN